MVGIELRTRRPGLLLPNAAMLCPLGHVRRIELLPAGVPFLRGLLSTPSQPGCRRRHTFFVRRQPGPGQFRRRQRGRSRREGRLRPPDRVLHAPWSGWSVVELRRDAVS